MRPFLTLFCLLVAGAACAEVPTPAQVVTWVNTGQLDQLTQGATTFVQLTDTHVPMTPDVFPRLPEVVTGVVAEINQLYPHAKFLADTGDNAGDLFVKPRFYQAYRDLFAAALMPVYYTPGNGLLVGGWGLLDHPDATKIAAQVAPSWPWQAVPDGDNLYLFLNDDWPLTHEGVMRKDELGWLHETLSAAADKNVFIFEHHPPRFLMNADYLLDLLKLHRPRMRQIIGIYGHTHQTNFRMEDEIPLFETGTFQDGVYRVFHIRPDCIISYVRHSSAWDKLKFAPAAPPALPNVIAGEPVILPTAPREAKPINPDDGYWGSMKVWKGNQPPPPGVVLRVPFDEGEGAFAFDQSGLGNDLYDNQIWKHYAQGPPPGSTGWARHEGGAALVGGKDGAFIMVAIDSYSLDSPALTNQLTLSADVNVPVQPVGWDYGIVGKEAYDLSLTKSGSACFKLYMTGVPVSRLVTLTAPEPLAAGVWHHLAGTFDGATMRLLVDGQVVAEKALPAGVQLCASGAPLVIDNYAWPWHGGDEARQSFLIDNVVVSNQAAP